MKNKRREEVEGEEKKIKSLNCIYAKSKQRTMDQRKDEAEPEEKAEKRKTKKKEAAKMRRKEK